MTLEIDDSCESAEQRDFNNRLIDTDTSTDGKTANIGTSTPASSHTDQKQLTKQHQHRGRHPVLRRIEEILPERNPFLYDPFIPLGAITVIAGPSGVSKSTFAADIAAKATQGLLDGDYKGKPVTVIYTGIEDRDSTEVKRLMAAGADMSKVLSLDMYDDTGGDDVPTVMNIPHDLKSIRRFLIEVRAKLWIIDPITSFLGGKDSNNRDDVRSALDPLALLAQELNIAIVNIQHFGKGFGKASEKISGSHAFRDAARSVILIDKNEVDNTRIITLNKSSYTDAEGTSCSFTIENTQVKDKFGVVDNAPKISNFKSTDQSVDKVRKANEMQYMPAKSRKRANPGETAAWIIHHLSNGPKSAAEVRRAGAGEGYTHKQIENAVARSEEIVSIPDPDHTGRGQKRLWQLKDTNQDTDPPAQAKEQ